MNKKKILIVDDDLNLSRLTKMGLEDTGLYDVKVVNHPKLAKAAAMDFSPDLIILDVIMPDMDGGAVASAIKEVDRLKHIPIVYFTSILSKTETAAKGGMMNEEVVLAKPVSINELLACVKKRLG